MLQVVKSVAENPVPAPGFFSSIQCQQQLPRHGKIARVIQSIASELLDLLPQRAIYWARQRMLIIADIHFGKAASFRAFGIPVPRGTTLQNLGVLDALLVQHEVDTIVFLGDFLHAANGRAPETLAAMQSWRDRQPQLRLLLVRGNHDAHAGDPPAALRIEIVDAPYAVGPFAFCHHPQQLPDLYVMAGHVHPVYRVTRRGDTLRLPCFLVGARSMILPSFGAFTGGHAITPLPDEQVYVAVEDAVMAVYASVRARRI